MENILLGNTIAKSFSEILKFNPYHDRLGRFTTGGGFMASGYTGDKSRQAVTFSANPNTRAGAMAIARESANSHEAIGRAYDNPKIPPKTATTTKPKTTKPKEEPAKNNKIAGVEPGKPMGFEQADNGNANPNYQKGGGYLTNCQSCVVTYVARTRGYDVQTKPNTRGSKLEELSHHSHTAWIDPKTGKTPTPERNKSVTTPKKCRNWLENTIKQGETYTFGHSWKGRSRSGHIICADRDSEGNLRLFDPQSGKSMIGKDVDTYLGRVKYKMTSYGMTINVGPRLLRVDNKDFNPEYVNYIMEGA